MTESYEDYEREYNANLSRIRSFLAGTRSHETLKECERLLGEAKRCATALQGLAEVEGNPLKIKEAQQKVHRDLAPLQKEIERNLKTSSAQQENREELFYRAPNLDGNQGNGDSDLEALISGSEDLLRESHALMLETEEIGNSTLGQMGRQREQIQNANSNLDATLAIAQQAGGILRDMSRKAWRSKMALYGMIGILIILNLWAFVRLFRRK